MHCKCTFARRRAPHESLCAWVDVGQIRRRSASRRYAAHDVPLRTCPGSRPHDRGSTARGKIGAALTAPTIPARDVCPFSMIGARSPGHLPATAVLLIVGAVGCFALLDACIKYLTRSYPVPVLVFARYLVQALPLGDATAINFGTPILVVLLAVVFLNERITPARWAFVAAGFAGMLLIVRPGASILHGAALLVLFGASLYAAFQILTRKLRPTIRA